MSHFSSKIPIFRKANKNITIPSKQPKNTDSKIHKIQNTKSDHLVQDIKQPKQVNKLESKRDSRRNNKSSSNIQPQQNRKSKQRIKRTPTTINRRSHNSRLPSMESNKKNNTRSKLSTSYLNTNIIHNNDNDIRDTLQMHVRRTMQYQIIHQNETDTKITQTH